MNFIVHLEFGSLIHFLLAPLVSGDFHFKRYNLPMLGKFLPPVNCVRELFKPSRLDECSSLLWKKNLVLDFDFLRVASQVG